MAVSGIDEEPAPSLALVQDEQQRQEAKARFSADTVVWLHVCSEAGGLKVDPFLCLGSVNYRRPVCSEAGGLKVDTFLCLGSVDYRLSSD